MNKFEVRDLNLYYGQFHALKGAASPPSSRPSTA